MTTKEELSELLQRFGIHIGFVKKRDAFAKRLLQGGKVPTEAELRLIWYELKDKRRLRNPGGVLARILEDGTWFDFVNDIRAMTNYQNPTPDDSAIVHDPAQWAYSRVVADGKPIPTVAKEMGLTEAKVIALTIQGAKSYGDDAKNLADAVISQHKEHD